MARLNASPSRASPLIAHITKANSPSRPRMKGGSAFRAPARKASVPEPRKTIAATLMTPATAATMPCRRLRIGRCCAAIGVI